MVQTHRVSLNSDAKTILSHINIKQYDVKTHSFVVTLIADVSFTDTDVIKAVVYTENKTLDIIVCSKNVSGQSITFTLTEASLYYSGTLLIELNVFNSTGKIKWTSPAFAIDVIPSAKGNVQNIDIESSLSSELLNIARTVNNKVDKYQNLANAGKVLVVGDDGKITFSDISAVSITESDKQNIARYTYNTYKQDIADYVYNTYIADINSTLESVLNGGA